MYFNDSATEQSSVEYKTKLYNANNKTEHKQKNKITNYNEQYGITGVL